MMMVSLFPKRRRRRSKPKLFEGEFYMGREGELFKKKQKEREREALLKP